MRYAVFPMSFTFMLAVTLALVGTYIPGVYDHGHGFGFALVADLAAHGWGIFYVLRHTQSVTREEA
jgi:hypothetical protein